MGIGSSIIVFAAGAIMRFAVTVTSISLNIRTSGVILIPVGAVGFVVSLVFWSSGGVGGYRRDWTVVGADGMARREREEVVGRP